ncbi:TPA: hypothetical protein ACUJK1_000917 [Streptococcus agalactiae]|uniref:Uncharacterized protein n=1 Tax=Streptococcus agalactiae CCUG 29376 TaxID=1105255 RepID=A0AAV3JH94_STRAG|nr:MULTISPECIES: hypothetical protein [Streptococcus]AQY25050.1 hypothetical protein B1H24_09880 [Streptococcus agalactiae]ASA80472.1 hypothetical protein BB161_09970 [Streptococcus agalactiae]EPT95179.1 hypothetical protein SAG0105_07980 [Streptococcus agalactiae BSU96]EPU53694.1 hypothetical protein SAG0301_03895 [Streptococcus agalactiae GB00003]EPU83869.1 hypothetical protein SAG0316_03485 [Streptococcus agalactiae GB00206]
MILKINEVLEKLGISRATLTRYRKKLGIFEETRSNITKSQFKELEKLANQRQKYTRQERVELSRKTFKLIPKEKMLEISDNDSVVLKNLKTQYNHNQKVIENFQLEINKVINDGELPDKYLLDGMEKYQKLNMQIMSTIEKQSPQGDSLKEMIQEKLARYG